MDTEAVDDLFASHPERKDWRELMLDGVQPATFHLRDADAQQRWRLQAFRSLQTLRAGADAAFAAARQVQLDARRRILGWLGKPSWPRTAGIPRGRTWQRATKTPSR